jgi:hypothetical protein
MAQSEGGMKFIISKMFPPILANEKELYKNFSIRKTNIVYCGPAIPDMIQSFKKYVGTLDEYQIAMRLKNHIYESSVGRQKRISGRQKRISFILHELLRLDPENKKEKLSQIYLRGMLGVDSKTIYNDMKFFITERLVISSRGYLPTPKLFQMWHYLSGLPEEHELFGIIKTEI